MTGYSNWVSTFGLVFAIIDPFGYVPIFLSMTSRDTETRRREMLLKACITACLVLIIFLFVGNKILGFFGISLPALQISGGLILLAIGFEMVKVLPVGEKLSEVEEREGTSKEDISIIPLAIPMLSGPASIATVVVLGTKASSSIDYAVVVGSVVITLAFTYLILRSAQKVLQLVGQTGLNVATRVMGLLLCAMAIQFLIDGYLVIRSGQ